MCCSRFCHHRSFGGPHSSPYSLPQKDRAATTNRDDPEQVRHHTNEGTAMPILAPMPPAANYAELNERARRSILRVMGVSNADTLHADALAEALRQANQLADENQD